MSSKKSRSRRLSSRRYSIPLFDDGVDPRKFFSSSDSPKHGRKALQLCSQIREALNATLAGECADPVLQDLFVVDVTPSAGSNRVVVAVELGPTSGGVSVEQALEHLERARGLLRSAVAAAIRRRRTPDLEFRVVRPEPPRSEEVES